MNNQFNLLVKISLVLIYLVIIAGAIVRMTGSGMGCPDWPKCFGYLIPPTEKSELIFSSFHDYNKGEMIILNSEKLYSATNDFKSNEAIDLNNWSLFEKHDYVVYDPLHTWVEYINRLIGALAGIPILLFTLISVYYWRDYKYLTLISILTCQFFVKMNQPSYKIVSLYSINSTIGSYENGINKLTQVELSKISNLSNPKNSLGIFEIPETPKIDFDKLIVGLDNVSDPGNLGTIIRLCDWFGIKDLICSLDSVDCYNPKVVQASMGSLSRVNINYVDIENIIAKNNIPVYGTYMKGNSIYEEALIQKGIVLFGNEANGISLKLTKLINHRISIPRFGNLQKTESLNVANAMAIVLSDNSRKSIEK